MKTMVKILSNAWTSTVILGMVIVAILGILAQGAVFYCMLSATVC